MFCVNAVLKQTTVAQAGFDAFTIDSYELHLVAGTARGLEGCVYAAPPIGFLQ